MCSLSTMHASTEPSMQSTSENGISFLTHTRLSIPFDSINHTPLSAPQTGGTHQTGSRERPRSSTELCSGRTADLAVITQTLQGDLTLR